jgi:hypothetical protein
MTCTQKSMYESWQMDNLLIMIFQNDILYDLWGGGVVHMSVDITDVIALNKKQNGNSGKFKNCF